MVRGGLRRGGMGLAGGMGGEVGGDAETVGGAGDGLADDEGDAGDGAELRCGLRLRGRQTGNVFAAKCLGLLALGKDLCFAGKQVDVTGERVGLGLPEIALGSVERGCGSVERQQQAGERWEGHGFRELGDALGMTAQVDIAGSRDGGRSGDGGNASMTGAPPPISTSQSASTRGSMRVCADRSRLKVADKGGLGPVDLVAVVAGEEGAVAAVAGLDKMDVGVGQQAGAGLGQDADEGVVLGVEDEGGDGDAVNDTGAGDAIVVVVGVSEAAIAGDDLVVEFAQGADRADAVVRYWAGNKAALRRKRPISPRRKRHS